LSDLSLLTDNKRFENECLKVFHFLYIFPFLNVETDIMVSSHKADYAAVGCVFMTENAYSRCVLGLRVNATVDYVESNAT